MTAGRALLPTASFGIRAVLRRRSLLAVFGLLVLAPTAQATVFSREQDMPDVKLGQRVRIDDGTCPAGEIKEVSGARMTETGVVRTRKCVPRTGPKRK
jgi:hypothetical protein